ncbi:MAG: T9SS type A sorting domain-containing protein, partial [Bacteroidales bacterium]|nr:T9SS type A sorting domain-containing protein [Bacteroidales bacterium]
DPSIGANGDYLYYINGGGVANTTNQYIASGQGFFVRATGGAGSLSLTNNDRVHNAKPFFKDVQKDVLVLKVTGNEVTTQTAVRFNKNATLEADRLYDVFKIISDKPDVPNLFTRSGSEPMAINTLPSIEETEVMPAWFSAGLNGKYSISATEIGSFDPSVPLYLEDLETKTIQNLRDNPEYSFDYSSGADRQFLIWFADPAQSNNSTENAKVYANGNTLHVNFPVSELSNRDFSAQVYVYDVTGRLINKTDTRQINNQIQLSGEATIYLVSIVAGDIVTNTKVFNN